MILHVVLLCSPQPAGGRGLAARLPGVFCRKIATCTRPTTPPSFSTDTACRSKEFSSSTAQQSFVDHSTRMRGRGGQKHKSSLLRPPSFSQKQVTKRGGGGHNSGAVQYTIYRAKVPTHSHVYYSIHMYAYYSVGPWYTHSLMRVLGPRYPPTRMYTMVTRML